MLRPGLCALILCLCLGSAQAEGPDIRIYPIPRLEAEQVVTAWLERQGCTVAKSTRDSFSELRATCSKRQWRLILKHHSPLATEIWQENTAADGTETALFKQLTAYLEGYTALQWETVPKTVLARQKSVVCIMARVQGKIIQVSGFVVDKDGLILCTAHTLNDPQALTVYLADGTRCKGRLIRLDDHKDLALIDCGFDFDAAVAIARDKTELDMGQRVYALGFPGCRRVRVLEGIVDGPPQLVENQPLLQVRMEIDPGSSGSPVFDEKGNLAAIVKGRLKGDNHSGLLIPLETIITFIKDS